MVYYNAKNGYVLIGKETTYGTYVSVTKDVGLVQNVTSTGNMNWTQTHGIGNTIVPQSLDSGRADISGSIECIFQHGRLLDYALGKCTHDNTSTPDEKKTYTQQTTTKFFTMEVGFDTATDKVINYHSVVLNDLTLALALDGYLRLRANWNAENMDPGSITAATSAVVSTLPPFKDFLTTLKWGTYGSEAALAGVQSFEVTFNNVGAGEPRVWGVDQRKPYASEWNQKTIDFRFGLLFSGVTEMQHFLGATSVVLEGSTELAKKGLILDMSNAVALGSGNRAIYLDLASCCINTITTPVAIGGYIVMDIAGFATSIDDFYTYDNIASTSWE